MKKVFWFSRHEMTLAEKYTIEYTRCDGCGASTEDSCICEYYPVTAYYFDEVTAGKAGVLVAEEEYDEGTMYLMADGSKHYQSYSGW